MNKFILSLVAIVSLSFTKDTSPVATSQSRALLTADIIFEGEITHLENNEAIIKIITPIWNESKNSNLLKQTKIIVPYASKTHYSVRGHIPNLNERAIFAFKMNEKTKKVKHFFRDWYITKLENSATQYYVWGKYSKTERQYASSDDIINSIKYLRESYHKNIDIDQEVLIKPKVTLSEIQQAKEKNSATKVWIEDIEAYNLSIKNK